MLGNVVEDGKSRICRNCFGLRSNADVFEVDDDDSEEAGSKRTVTNTSSSSSRPLLLSQESMQPR
jgi:hypothetical protein